MAFRGGTLIRRFISSSLPKATSAAADSPASPSTTLFISGLNKRTTSEKLHETFAKFGEVVHARVVIDRSSGFSKGYGFVRYSNLQDAEQGLKGMDAKLLDGWVIFAEYARPRIPGQTTQET